MVPMVDMNRSTHPSRMLRQRSALRLKIQAATRSVRDGSECVWSTWRSVPSIAVPHASPGLRIAAQNSSRYAQRAGHRGTMVSMVDSNRSTHPSGMLRQGSALRLKIEAATPNSLPVQGVVASGLVGDNTDLLIRKVRSI